MKNQIIQTQIKEQFGVFILEKMKEKALYRKKHP